MSVKHLTIIASMAVTSLLWITPASAMTAAECSTQYQAAKAAGTLNGMSWNAYRKAQCSGSATAAAATTAPAAATTATATGTAKPAKKSLSSIFDTSGDEPTAANTESAPEPAAPTMVAPKGVSFPSAISSSYASETPAKARMHTCLDQYKTNKSDGSLGGLKWIQKGGGYYSLCNARLKG